MEGAKTLKGITAYQAKCCINIQEDKTWYMFQQMHTWELYIPSLKTTLKPPFVLKTSYVLYCLNAHIETYSYNQLPSGRPQTVFPQAEFGLWLWNRCTIRKCLQYKHFHYIYGRGSEIPLNQFRMLLWGSTAILLHTDT